MENLRTYDVKRIVSLAVVVARQRKTPGSYYEHLYNVLKHLSKELSEGLRCGLEYFDYEITDLPF